jgi:thiol:disulfide interchange protein DsbA
MARKPDPNSATSQFFINLKTNPNLDLKGNQVGYTVFGKVVEGMVVLDRIAAVPTRTVGPYRDVPEQDIVILSATRKSSSDATQGNSQSAADRGDRYIAGRDYTLLDKPVATRDRGKIEVVEMFSYGCPHCYEFEPFIRQWAERQPADVDFRQLPAIWNEPMKLFARAYYAEDELNVAETTHEALFTAVVIDQVKIENESDLAEFFGRHGVEANTFAAAFHSEQVTRRVDQAEALVKAYNPVGVPEVVVNGKYRVDRMRAGGLPQMLAVLDYLVEKERAASSR